MSDDTIINELLAIDQQHIWHPYSAMDSTHPVYLVNSANGVYITLADGRKLIDGMSSWWAAIHGYNHPAMNSAIENQLHNMAHIMFGGLTHLPAINLTQKLLSIIPDPLQNVFYSDSGSVAIEIALKMAIQYWNSIGKPEKQRFIALRSGYHGDTLGAMSVCDPLTGMHTLFNNVFPEQIFINQPKCRFGESCSPEDISPLEQILKSNNDIAALVMEPIVQGAGGMWFYSSEFLQKARELSHEYNVLLILDEIATGFGRTGKLFACEHAGIVPDIMCLGKALTGGYLSMAATITTKKVSEVIDKGEPGIFMHGPTFMANPLACTAALTSILLLQESDWQNNVLNIQNRLESGLAPCRNIKGVKDVRVLGAIGVVEMDNEVNLPEITRKFVDAGVWIRPFGKLIYLMPPYIIKNNEINILCGAIIDAISGLETL